MAISTNGLQLARIAGAVFNQQLSASDYSEILAANKTAAELDAWANAAVAAEFRNKTTTDIAKAVLANVGLSSVAGLEAWVAGQLTAGGGVAKAGASMLAMLNDFSNMTSDATYGAAATTFNQKAANSQVLSQTAGTAGGTYDAVSTAAPSAAFTLTTGVDLKTTGAGADTYTSVNPTAATSTLTAGDNLNGGAGTDTLSITSAAEMTLGAGVTTTDIENVTVSASGGTLTLDTALMTGITSVANNGSTAAVSVTGLKALVPVSVTATSANTTVGFATAVTSGSADAITVNINGVGTSLITANGFETINVASSGSASGGSSSSVNGTTVASTTLTTLNVTGTAAAKLVANLAGASASVTGTLTSDDSGHDIELTGRALTDKLSITMAGGNDTVRIDNMAATYTLSGGDGTDTLRYSGAAAVPLASTANVTGIETVTLTNATPASFAMTGAGVTTVNYTTAAAGTFGGLSTGGTIGLNLGGSMTAAAAGAAATATAAATLAAATYSGTADSLTVNVGLATQTTNPGATTSTVSAVGVESVTFNSLAGSGVTEARTVTFADTTATTATLKTITVTGSIPALTTVAVTNTGTSALTTANLAGVTGGASFTGGATTGASITGGVGNDSLTGAAGPDTVIGGEGNDTLGGAAGADSIDGGNGANSITGGTGADTMTGGTGVDTYAYTGNTTTGSTLTLNSTTSAPDTITNFTSGTDKISITGTYAPSKFLGNFTNIQAALSYQAGANGLAYGAAYVTGENTLYVLQNTNGLLNADDLAIKLTNVATLAEGDLFLGSITGGNSITLNASNASVTTSGTTTGAQETTAATNSPSGSTNTTTFNDTVTATLANLSGATLTGGTGTDTLALSVTAGQAAFTMPTTVTEFETITLANYAPTSTANNTTFSVTLAAGNVAANTTLTVTNSNTGTDFDGSVTNNRTVFTGTNALSSADRKLNYTGSAGSESITGGAGNDTINGGAGNDAIFGAAGSNTLNGEAGDDAITSASLTDTIDGGAGNDTVTLITGAYTGTLTGGSVVPNTDTLAVVHNTDIDSATVSGFEVIDFAGAQTSILLISAAQLAAVASLTSTGAAAPASTTITIDATTTAKATGSITIDADAIIYTVAAGAVAGVTINGISADTTAVSVTGGDGADTINFGTHGAANQTLIGGAGNDTITIATSTLTAADVLEGGDGAGDTLVLAGDVALSNVSASLVNGFETIQIQNTTTNVSITLLDAGLASTITQVITTAQTSGTLTIDGALEADGKFNITGGNAADSLVGGAGADTLSGGLGSDTLVGGAGNDTITTGAGNNTVVPGLGVDTINLTDGGSDVIQLKTEQVFGTPTVTTSNVPNTPAADSVSGFTVADQIAISIAKLTVGSHAGLTISTGNGVDINAAGVATTMTSVAANAAAVTTHTDGGQIIKLTSITGESFATAIGTTSVTIANVASDLNLSTTVGAGEGLLVLWYDSINSKAVLSIYSATNGDTALTSGDAASVVDVVSLTGITSAVFTSLTAANFAFIS